ISSQNLSVCEGQTCLVVASLRPSEYLLYSLRDDYIVRVNWSNVRVLGGKMGQFFILFSRLIV
uniref:Uncharacterized protein n=1 Tax=Ciona intestinalis TaxID=7719 RepID=H2XX25_CIOIN